MFKQIGPFQLLTAKNKVKAGGRKCRREKSIMKNNSTGGIR